MTPTPPRSACPICARPASDAVSPFCSKRCADVDLGRWFTGQYRVPDMQPTGGEEGVDPPDGSG